MPEEQYVIGIDYGTDSVRAVLFHAGNGDIVGQATSPFSRWAQGDYCDPVSHQYRQHPLDYLEGLQVSVKEALSQVSKDVVQNIKALSRRQA